MLNLYALKVGDEIIVGTRGSTPSVMTVYRIDPPGTYATSHTDGPHINAHIRPGGYGLSFDYSHLRSGSIAARTPAEHYALTHSDDKETS